MYDMYPWNEPNPEAGHDQDQNAAPRLPAPRDGAAPRNGTASGNRTAPRNGARHADDSHVPADFTRAVQFALDRRDNGGDAVPAGQPVTPPAVSLTRQ